MNKEHVQTDKMHNALTAIATEMQRFYTATVTSSNSENDDIFEKNINCQSTLKLKKKQVQKLRENLKVACDIAKIVISSKENATGLLKSHLTLAKNESATLFEKQSEYIETINSLTVENNILRDDIQHFGNFIELGYKELQKLRKERLEELPVIMQLKKLIICCNQYYTNYNKEHERSMRLEQSNRFLFNKINILENSIEAISEELRNLRYHNLRLLNENNFIKDKYVNAKSLKSIDLICSEYRIEKHIIFPSEIQSNMDVDKDLLERKIYNGLDLTSHLCTVKRLLSDQDTLLEDLSVISQELCID